MNINNQASIASNNQQRTHLSRISLPLQRRLAPLCAAPRPHLHQRPPAAGTASLGPSRARSRRHPARHCRHAVTAVTADTDRGASRASRSAAPRRRRRRRPTVDTSRRAAAAAAARRRRSIRAPATGRRPARGEKMTGTGLAAPPEGREVVNCPEWLRVVRTGRMRGRESTMTVSYGRGCGLSLSKVCQDGGIFFNV